MMHLRPNEAERVILSVCLDRPDALVSLPGGVTAEVFGSLIHGRVYTLLREAYNADRPLDATLLPLEYSRAYGSGDVGEVIDLHGYAPASVVDLTSYVDAVLRAALARELRHAAEALAGKAPVSSDPVALASRASAHLADLAATYDSSDAGPRNAKERRRASIDRMQAQANGEQTEASPIPTGIDALDSALGGGLRRGELIIVAGRPGMGKTALAHRLLTTAAECCHKAGGFWLEMTEEEMSHRELAAEAGMPVSLLRQPQHMKQSDWDAIIEAEGGLEVLDTVHDFRSALTIEHIERQTAAWAAQPSREGGLALVVIDYLQIMGGIGAENRSNLIGQVTGRLKSMAKRHHVAVVLLSQLNRAVESRKSTGYRPQMSDLRASGSIEQDANVILFPFRPYYYEARDEGLGPLAFEDDALVIIGKQRQGPPGDVPVGFRGPTVEYCDRDAASHLAMVI